MGKKYDFSGWATKFDVKCADGRTIRKNAFNDNDGQVVPLVWQHIHSDPMNVLGHALLKCEDEGIRAYGTFNNTEAGQNAKALVEHGDVRSLSIYANHLKQNGGNVLHGAIREVSLVLAGANPEAYIDFPIVAHSDEEVDECVAWTGEYGLELAHADNEEDKEQKEPPKEEPKEEKKDMAEKTVQDVFDELTEEQKNVVYFMIGQALEDAGVSDEEDDEEMKHNVFDMDTAPESVLSHSDMDAIFRDAKRMGSLRDAVTEYLDGAELYHADDEQTYGIRDINYLFPEAKSLNNPPEWISREMGWVAKVMNGVHHTPFTRIKSQYANITEDDARARGYIKGKLKKEEVFSLLKRSTTPQTIYKKQKLDRDDIIDITDFDVVAWLKSEMRVMLDEEIARAILVGDGRLPSDDDHISEDHVRPIWTDHDLFAVKVVIAKKADAAVNAKNFIDGVIRSRKEYKGSGNPKLFTTEDFLTEMLLLEDGIGHKLYKTEAELATTLRVSEIVTVPVMEGLKDSNNNELAGIIVNLTDYNVGADKGGAVNMFDDFDIDYNQQKYLIETRCSGALIKPFSAIVISFGETASMTTMESALKKPLEE